MPPVFINTHKHEIKIDIFAKRSVKPNVMPKNHTIIFLLVFTLQFRTVPYERTVTFTLIEHLFLGRK
jgi:hypothetical protein